MTISGMRALIAGLIDMIDKGDREDETNGVKLDEHQKGYNKGYRDSLESLLGTCNSCDAESIVERREEVEGWLRKNGYTPITEDVGDNLWTRINDCIIVRLRPTSMKVTSACGLNADCGYGDVRISGSGTLRLGDRAWVYPPEEEED